MKHIACKAKESFHPIIFRNSLKFVINFLGKTLILCNGITKEKKIEEKKNGKEEKIER